MIFTINLQLIQPWRFAFQSLFLQYANRCCGTFARVTFASDWMVVKSAKAAIPARDNDAAFAQFLVDVIVPKSA
jgi:hypothetical protein